MHVKIAHYIEIEKLCEGKQLYQFETSIFFSDYWKGTFKRIKEHKYV